MRGASVGELSWLVVFFWLLLVFFWFWKRHTRRNTRRSQKLEGEEDQPP
jgi:hypothetical protein